MHVSITYAHCDQQTVIRPHNGTTAPGDPSRLHFEWRVSGFTAVCFWTVLRRWIAALEGPVGFRV